jgi:hypothetical protein
MTSLRESLVFVLAIACFCSSLLNAPTHARAAVPPWNIVVRYTTPSYSYVTYSLWIEDYVKQTLPNEWIPSWNPSALQAGAVIIRSGAYWMTQRSVYQNGYPNNNCYGFGSQYYVTAPNSRGGYEQFVPGSSQASTNSATDAVYPGHAETVVLAPGRPDKFIGVRHNAGQQSSTQSASGDWLARFRAVYNNTTNAQCSQTDFFSPANPYFLFN